MVIKKMKSVVTVAVITFQSSKTILETLDSIFCQDYGSENIELIISDDASQDNTNEIIETWIDKHSKKFERIYFHQSNVNRGISKNVNIAWRAATSDWIKTIAGDDILLPNCLTDNVEFVKRNSETKIVFSGLIYFDGKVSNVLKYVPYEHEKYFFQLPANIQYKVLLKRNVHVSPASFISRSLLMLIDYCDEKYSLIEDWPLWLKITNLNIKLDYFDKPTVGYRYGDALSQGKSTLMNYAFSKQEELLLKEIVWPKLHGLECWRILDYKIDQFSKKLIVKIFGNKKSIVSIMMSCLTLMVRPRSYLFVLRKITKGKIDLDSGIPK